MWSCHAWIRALHAHFGPTVSELMLMLSRRNKDATRVSTAGKVFNVCDKCVQHKSEPFQGSVVRVQGSRS